MVRPSSVIHFTTGRISGAYSTSPVEDYHDCCGTKFAAIIGSSPSYGCAFAEDELAEFIPVKTTDFEPLGRGFKSFWPDLEFVYLGSTKSDFWCQNCFSRP